MLAQRDVRSLNGAIARIVLAATLLAGLALVSPQAAAARYSGAAPFIDGGTVTLAFDVDPSDLDPANNVSEYGDTVVRNMDETLVRLAGSTPDSYVPDLATSWSSNTDQSVWTFRLRQGVRFHSGRCCLTAADVRYSLGRSVAAKLAGSYMLGRFLIDPFKQIKVLDPYTVEFDLGRPQPFFLNAVGQDYNALILDAQAVKAHATKGDPWAHDWLALHDAGTGPYSLQSWTHGQRLVLMRYPNYWGGWSGPHFSKVILETIQDSSTRREVVEHGQADLTFDLTPQDYDLLAKNPAVRVIAPYGTEVVYIVMTEAGPLASPAARQALSYAFNYDALIKGIYHGYAKRAYGCLASTLLGYDPQTFHYQTDLSKARALLRQAGVMPGTTLTYTYYPASPNAAMGLILQAQLAQLGITLKLQQVDEAAFDSMFFGDEPASKRPNLFAYAWWPDYNDPFDECNTLVASSQAAPNGINGGIYHNQRVDALLKEMQYADRQTVTRDAFQLQDLTGRVDPPAIWAAEPAQATALAANLHGYTFNPILLRTFYFYTMYR